MGLRKDAGVQDHAARWIVAASVLATAIAVPLVSASLARADELAYPAHPPELDEAADAADRSRAVSRTQADLLQPSRRAAIASSDPAATAADARVKNLTGGDPALDQEVYGVAADIVPTLDAQAGGDPARMQAILERAMSDPAGFAASLSPEQRSRIEALGQRIEDRQAPPD